MSSSQQSLRPEIRKGSRSFESQCESQSTRAQSSNVPDVSGQEQMDIGFAEGKACSSSTSVPCWGRGIGGLPTHPAHTPLGGPDLLCPQSPLRHTQTHVQPAVRADT